MRVALYHPYLKERGGAEKVILEYTQRSEHEVTVFTLHYDQGSTFQEFEELDVKEIGLGLKPTGFLTKGLVFGLGSFLAKIPSSYNAVIISETGLGSFATFRNRKHELICYCHTPLRAALPEFKQRYRKEMNKVLRLVFDLAVGVYSKIEKIAWKHFEKVIANSNVTRERIRNKGIYSGDIDVINPGADIEGNNHGEFKNYFLYPSRFRRYKRQDLAIEAFEEAGLDDFKLVLAGSNQEPDYVEELREKAGENVEIETDVSGERWKELFANCYTVLFLAENEDWGIIPIEAASYGKPVIAVNEGGPQESVNNSETGFLVETDARKIADKMEFFVGNVEEAKKMGRKGLEESKKYSWENFTKKIDKLIGK